MKKPTNSLTRTQTASWQYDSMDLAAGMDNKDHPSYKQLSKFSGNPSKSPAGNPDSINAGRGATRGNTNPTGVGPATAPTANLVDAWKSGSKSLYAGTYSGAGQARTPGGVKEFPIRGKESFDFGRGPTKGNAQ